MYLLSVPCPQAKGDYVDSFSSRLLKPENGNILTTEEESIARWVSGGLYAGGADTVRQTNITQLAQSLKRLALDRVRHDLFLLRHDALPRSAKACTGGD